MKTTIIILVRLVKRYRIYTIADDRLKETVGRAIRSWQAEWFRLAIQLKVSTDFILVLYLCISIWLL